MSEDISKRTITVLVVLTVLISLLGTLTVLNEVGQLELGKDAKSSSNKGKVSLTILPGAENSAPTAATGRVGLELREPEEEEQDNDILLLPEANT